MQTRILAYIAVVLVATAVILGLVNVALAQPLQPSTTCDPTSMINGMGGGMMNGGMMGGMMGRGMGPSRPSNPNQPYDLRFLSEMTTHHQMGVMMTQHMVVNSTRPEMRDLAQRIITAQQREITQMQQWRRAWYPNATGGSMMGNGMMGGGMMGGMGMMGSMMNSDHMRQMHPNADFDLMFLQMMIPHHEDAITMAEQALQQAEHPDIKALAQDIVTTQRAEIEEMRGYLRDWYGIQ
jgi:uncharacterized protein (DUF305 family)